MTAAVQDTAPEDIANALLEFLCDALGSCSYAEPPVALAPGNETLICAFRLRGLAPPLDGPLVLRLFTPGTEPEHALGEAAIQNAVADQGFPAARAYATCASEAVLGGPFFVMERVPGDRLLGDTVELDRTGTPQLLPWAALRRGLQALTDMPRTLAEVDARMHALDVPRVIAALEEAHVPWRTRTVEGRLQRIALCVDKAAADGLRPGVEWLHAHLPSSTEPLVICHGDMQPLNLMVRDAQVSGVLDWSNTLFAPAECEIAWTRATFLTLPLPLPAPLRPAERLVAAQIANAYTRAYRRACGRALDEDAVRYHEAFHDMLILAETAGRAAEGVFRRDAWSSPRAVEKLAAHFSAISGKSVAPPPA